LLRSHLNSKATIENRGGNFSEEKFPPHPPQKTLAFEVGQRYMLTVTRESDFTEEERTVAEVAACICTILLRHRDATAAADKKRRAKAVRAIINSLSFSELDAAAHIVKTFDQNGKNEGILVAGNIADKLGFARSVITGTLRKLEGASLIETRSLGMKGTYIKIKDTLLIDELGKL